MRFSYESWQVFAKQAQINIIRPNCVKYCMLFAYRKFKFVRKIMKTQHNTYFIYKDENV